MSNHQPTPQDYEDARQDQALAEAARACEDMDPTTLNDFLQAQAVILGAMLARRARVTKPSQDLPF